MRQTVPQCNENTDPLEVNGLPLHTPKDLSFHTCSGYLQEDYATAKTASSRWHLFSSPAVSVKQPNYSQKR